MKFKSRTLFLTGLVVIGTGFGSWLLLQKGTRGRTSHASPTAGAGELNQNETGSSPPPIGIQPNGSDVPGGEDPPALRLSKIWEAKNFDAAASEYAKWLESSPEEALDFINGMEPPLIPEHFGPNIQSYLESLDRKEALELVDRLSNLHLLQISVSQDLFADWIREDSQNALEWLSGHTSSPWIDGLAFQAGSLGYLEPGDKALTMLQTLPENAVRTILKSSLMTRWIHNDSEKALAYLNDIPQSPDFDKTFEFYAETLMEKWGPEAMTWAEKISDVGTRSMLIEEIQKNWSEDDARRYEELQKSP